MIFFFLPLSKKGSGSMDWAFLLNQKKVAYNPQLKVYLLTPVLSDYPNGLTYRNGLKTGALWATPLGTDKVHKSANSDKVGRVVSQSCSSASNLMTYKTSWLGHVVTREVGNWQGTLLHRKAAAEPEFCLGLRCKKHNMYIIFNIFRQQIRSV